MQVRLVSPGLPPRSLIVTMRTPGHDFELAAGFLLAEGIIGSADDLVDIAYCLGGGLAAEQLYNVVTVRLAGAPRATPAERYGPASSACGVCGTQSLDRLTARESGHCRTGPVLAAELLRGLPGRLRAAQQVFARTGGLHAAGLFTAAGQLLCAREDVGRHNAVDKVVGWAVLSRRTTELGQTVLVVSGRVGFEIAQKAVAAGIPLIVAVGAPSSLAVDAARRFGSTLVGFARDDRLVVYTGAERVAAPAAARAAGALPASA